MCGRVIKKLKETRKSIKSNYSHSTKKKKKKKKKKN